MDLQLAAHVLDHDGAARTSPTVANWLSSQLESSRLETVGAPAAAGNGWYCTKPGM